MQTFLPYASFARCAKVLDRRRLCCQRKEVGQILQTLKQGPEVVFRLHVNEKKGGCVYGLLPKDVSVEDLHLYRVIKTPWYNHPNVKIWKGYELCLIDYGMAMCDEWVGRGYVDNMKSRIKSFADAFPEGLGWRPEWMTEELHQQHRYKLQYKDPAFYEPLFGLTLWTPKKS